ncbi:MAG: ATP-dependent DNA helicase RecG [Bilifractor sp.]
MKEKIPSDSIRNLKGIGEKSEVLFNRLGIFTMEELIRYYPREYDIYEEPVPIGQVIPGQKNAILGRITRKPTVKSFGGNSITMVYLKDESGSLQINWFHMPFLASALKPGMVCVFRGVVVKKNGRMIMEHPEFFSPSAYDERKGQMLPIYALTKGLSNQAVRKAAAQVLQADSLIPEILPEEIRESLGLPEINFAVHQIHFPDSREHLMAARDRLSFDEFFLFLLGVSFVRETNRDKCNHFPMKAVWKTEDVINSLPYHLTKAQQRVWGELERDLASGTLMNRLIQGDVGSGKTILAFLAMIMSYENGYQSALMVPTEVLAGQHYAALLTLLKNNGIRDACPVLLTGSCTMKEKHDIYEKTASGEAKMIIGTHALIQESIQYKHLGHVITDEQHRFGVRQRMTLTEKGDPPNVLVMSATPIPRTLAMILYGDLDISVLDSRPDNRLPVKNAVVGTSYRESAYKFIEKQIAAGHQAYIICPMVEPNDEMTCENVTDYSAALRKRFRDPIRVGMLHGRMKPQQKREIMSAFAANEIQILVSTTVIEVGVNVPNATVMLIENAEQFGLAQLHQLRGRVGRGNAQSYCIFMQGDGKKNTSKRLDILSRSNDGFQIAEEDLRLRGPGDLFGVRQSGIADFHIADIYRDSDLLNTASQAVKEVLALDPHLNLPQHQTLRQAIAHYMNPA